MSAKPKEQTQEVKTLVGKLVEILSELGPMAKSKRNPHFGYNYIGEGQVMAELRHRLSSRGVFLFTSVESINPHFNDDNPKAGVYVTVTTLHTFFDAETKEQFAVRSAGVGWDSGDKGAYKAITGAMKYALMKCFLITDEQDPEADEKAPTTEKAAGKGQKHNRFTEYEEKTGEGDQKVVTDLLELKSFLTEHKIPDAFLIRMLQEKELIDGHTKNVAQLKPGILARCLSPKSKENLIGAYKQYVADEDSGSATAPGLGLGDKKKADPNVRVVTNEGDQRRKSRQPIDPGTDVKDFLEQEGIKDWREVKIHFGDQRGERLGDLTAKSLKWWMENWKPKKYRGRWEEEALLLDAALCVASAELGGAE